ncbi:uncharacterized protein LOC123987885 [Osmia bicornis bicornis]|uniref:uncharacterized protein LOC123987885 n=1 Tax=Osmia bicornis bicornis TaxID=1437191 RepID=UPI001EAEE066|nr:uncharacterized protein LOC123987885 [Osmia bicornis bicornis]
MTVAGEEEAYPNRPTATILLDDRAGYRSKRRPLRASRGAGNSAGIFYLRWVAALFTTGSSSRLFELITSRFPRLAEINSSRASFLPSDRPADPTTDSTGCALGPASTSSASLGSDSRRPSGHFRRPGPAMRPTARLLDTRAALIVLGFEPLWPIALIRSLPCPWEGQQQRQQQQQRPTCTHSDCKKRKRPREAEAERERRIR